MIKFDVLNRWSGKVQFSAEINCAASASIRIKVGLALKWAYESGADLSGAVLSDAVMRGADLSGAVLSDAVLSGAVMRGADLSDAVLSGAVMRGADLSGADLSDAVMRGADLSDAVLSGAVMRGADLSDADLSDAVLSGADLSGAVLSGAVMRGADLSGADLSDAVLSGVPIIPKIDAAILASIEANKAAGKNGLKMSGWHGAECNETNWCETTHCRAGYAICLAGKAGFALERKIGAATAGALIYAASRPGESIPNFYTNDETAMADIKACAAKQNAEP